MSFLRMHPGATSTTAKSITTSAFVFYAIDKEGEANKSGFDTVFEDGTTLASVLRITTNFFDRPGHILVAGTWCNEVTGFEDRFMMPQFNQPFGGILGFAEDEENGRRDRPILRFLRQLPRLTEEESRSFYANFDQAPANGSKPAKEEFSRKGTRRE